MEERKVKDVARALGRIIKESYSGKVECIGSNKEKNVIYLKLVEE